MTDGPHGARDAKGKYKGPLPNLKDRKASLVLYDNGRCLAQFDDEDTGYAYGYHDFDAAHFEIEDSHDA